MKKLTTLSSLVLLFSSVILPQLWANESCNYSVERLREVQQLLIKDRHVAAFEILTDIIEESSRKNPKTVTQAFTSSEYFSTQYGHLDQRRAERASYGKALAKCIGAGYINCKNKASYITSTGKPGRYYSVTVVLGTILGTK